MNLFRRLFAKKPRPDAPTERQMAYLDRLLWEVSTEVEVERPPETLAEASELITWLRALRDREPEDGYKRLRRFRYGVESQA